MTKFTGGRLPWGLDANRFPKVDETESPSHCIWRGCQELPFDDLPICLAHAVHVHCRLKEAVHLVTDCEISKTPRRRPPEFVYYLMLSPMTVKIGTTTNLVQRVSDFQSEMQYVVGLERGGRKLEHQRHKEFADERIRREHFRLSDRLKAHIESLRPQTNELLGIT